MEIEARLRLRELALQERSRALSAAELVRARDPDSHCYIERFGRLPFRYLAEAFERYAADLQRQADDAVAGFASTSEGEIIPPFVEPVREGRRRRRGGEDEPAV